MYWPPRWTAQILAWANVTISDIYILSRMLSYLQLLVE
jgi:hypothetical protein